MGTVVSVNVGPVARFLAGRSKTSAIVKVPVGGDVAATGMNLAGDDQADRDNHGGPDQAVYAYSRESYAWWETQLGFPLAPGTFGENLTTEGVDVDAALIGDRWLVGTVLLEVTAPRIPCHKLAKRMADPLFVKRFAHARRPGAYLRIVEEGVLRAGDAIDLLKPRLSHAITVTTVNEALLFDHSLAPSLLTAPALAARAREWAETWAL